jgi:hypothetical protein
MLEIFHYKIYIFLNHPSAGIFLKGIAKARKNKIFHSTFFPPKNHELWRKECLIFMREIFLKDASLLQVSIIARSLPIHPQFQTRISHTGFGANLWFKYIKVSSA